METARFSAPRRSATAPVGLAQQPAGQGGVETLYNHPNAKIVAFTATARAVPRSPSPRDSDEDLGTLSWSSQLERTIAVGTFRIYRAPGSVAFLNCGSALQPILPRSQCWCIEEDSSRFVLQIRRPQYWRIELPVADPEDARRAAVLREILDGVLLFEKTRCPFKRSFTVRLPEPMVEEPRKRPWTPRRSLVGPLPASPEGSPTPTSRSFPNSPLRANESPTAARFARTAVDGRGGLKSEHGEAERAKGVDGLGSTNSAAVTDTRSRTDSFGTCRADGSEPGAPSGEANSLTEEAEGQDDPQEGQARVETPVKVKEVVSVIEERITEDPTPLTAVNEAISQAQQAAALSPTVSPSSKARSPDARNVTPRSAATTGATASATTAPTTVTTPSTPGVDAGVSSRVSTYEPTQAQQGPAISPAVSPTSKEKVPGMRNVTPLPETTTAAVTTSSVDSKAPPRMPTYEPLEYGRPSVAAREDPQPAPDMAHHATPPTSEGSDAEEPAQEEALASDVVDEVHEGAGQGANILRKRKLRRYGGFSSGRSSAMPPHLTVVTSQPGKIASKPASIKPIPASPAGSFDSFHSARSPATPPAPSPQTFPYPHDNIFLPPDASGHRDVSDLTITPQTRCTWDALSASSGASQFSAITAPDRSVASEECGRSIASEDGACSSAVARSTIRHRSTASISTNRALSPLPPAATLFNPKPRAPRRESTRMEVLRRVPMAIVQKTCEVLLGPPAYLVQLMLRVAARIVAGEWSGVVSGEGEGGERMRVWWDYEDGDMGGWSEDEMVFGTPEEGSVVRFGGAREEEEEEEEVRGWGVD